MEYGILYAIGIIRGDDVSIAVTVIEIKTTSRQIQDLLFVMTRK
jgi:hypothetical protein